MFTRFPSSSMFRCDKVLLSFSFSFPKPRAWVDLCSHCPLDFLSDLIATTLSLWFLQDKGTCRHYWLCVMWPWIKCKNILNRFADWLGWWKWCWWIGSPRHRHSPREGADGFGSFWRHQSQEVVVWFAFWLCQLLCGWFWSSYLTTLEVSSF